MYLKIQLLNFFEKSHPEKFFTCNFHVKIIFFLIQGMCTLLPKTSLNFSIKIKTFDDPC